MRRILLFPTIFLLLLGGLCFLISAGPFTRSGAAKRPVVMGIIGDIKTLDVGEMSWANDIRAAMALYEGLTSYNTQGNLEPIAAAAERWEISDDKRTYTFHLRANGRWSNGDPVTTDDFVFAWRRALTPVTGAEYIGLMKDIEGAEEYTAALTKYADEEANYKAAQGRSEAMAEPAAPGEDIPGIRKIDGLTLQVHLKNPCTYFLDLVAMPIFFPLNERSMEAFKQKDGSYDGGFTLAPHLVSNGPFMLADWRVKRDATFAPNPYYWDQANVHCPGLRMETINDSRAALLEFQSGEVDMLTFAPQDFTDSMLQQREQKVNSWPELHASPVFGSYYYVFNVTRKPFDDKRVRRALAMSVDRKQVVAIMNAGQTPLGLIVPFSNGPYVSPIRGYVSPPEMPYDVAAARKLLAEAGYPGGRGLPAVELLYNSEGMHERIAQAVGQMWQTNLNVKVTYRGLDNTSFSNARAQDHDFDIARGGWYGDYPDPTTWLDIFRSDDGNNDGKFSCKPYDDLMAQSDAQADPAKRFELLRQAEDMLVNQEAAIVPLYQYADGFIYDEKKIKGAEMNARTLIQPKYIQRVE